MWQDILTVPRDDTVLVYSKNKGYMLIAYKGRYSDEWCDDCGEELGIDDGELTHWMPLPESHHNDTP